MTNLRQYGDYNFDTGVWTFDDTRRQWSMLPF
jgi:hypothetical protein